MSESTEKIDPRDLLENFNFSCEPIEFGPFTITDQRGTGAQYILVEASEDAHIAYKNATMKGLKITGEKGGEFVGGAEADAVLVSKCLFRLVPGATMVPLPSAIRGADSGVPVLVNGRQQVTYDFVKALPRRISARLYAKVRAMSGMDEDQETEAFLTARITSDQEKLAKLRKDGTPGKGEPSFTHSTSV